MDRAKATDIIHGRGAMTMGHAIAFGRHMGRIAIGRRRIARPVEAAECPAWPLVVRLTFWACRHR